MGAYDLPEETPCLGEESPTPAAKQSQSQSLKGAKNEYEKAVAYMKRSLGNATIYTTFSIPVDLRAFADEQEGGPFKLMNRNVDVSGPHEKRGLDEILIRAQTAGSKLPKSRRVEGRPSGNVEVIPQTGTTLCVEQWNGEKGRTRSGFAQPPTFKMRSYIDKDTDEYAAVDAISRKLNKILRHQAGKETVVSQSGRVHESLPCNEGGWVNVQDVLMYGHIFNDNNGNQIRDAKKQGYLTEMLMTRYYRCCQAMWFSRKLQNRVRFQTAPVRISPGDAMKEEQRENWKSNFKVRNDAYYFRGHELCLFPVAMRAVSSRNPSSQQTEISENDVTLYPHLTSRDITDPIAISPGGSFHVKSIGRVSSKNETWYLAQWNRRGTSCFNRFAPWDNRARDVLRSRIPTIDIPVVLYLPVATLKSLGARLAESSYVIMFKEIAWDRVKGAWYQDPTDNEWKRMLARGVTNHLITAATHQNKIATKDQIIEKAKEVIAGGTKKDENAWKLDDIINSKDFNDMKKPWNLRRFSNR